MASSASEAAPRLRVERIAPGIAALTIDSAGGANAMDLRFCGDLQAACETLAADATLHALVLRARGPTFCVGADLGTLLAHADDLVPYTGGLIDNAHAAGLALRRFPVPVIASVQAVAAGGGFSLAMLCDEVLASEAARFVPAYPALGTSPDCGLTHTLALRTGPRRAQRLALDTQAIAPDRALALGIADALVPAAQLDAATLARAQSLCAVPRTALVETKAHFLREDLPVLAARLDQEKEAFLRCAATPAFRERLAAFGQRRRTG